MLFILQRDGKETPWHLGEKWPLQDAEWEDEERKPIAGLIQADGEELDYIRLVFTGLKDRPLSRVVRFSTDDSHFICMNLCGRM